MRQKQQQPERPASPAFYFRRSGVGVSSVPMYACLFSLLLKEKVHINLFIIIFLTIKHNIKLFISLKSLSFFHLLILLFLLYFRYLYTLDPFFWQVSMLVLSVFCNQYTIERKSSHQFIHNHFDN